MLPSSQRLSTSSADAQQLYVDSPVTNTSFNILNASDHTFRSCVVWRTADEPVITVRHMFSGDRYPKALTFVSELMSKDQKVAGTVEIEVNQCTTSTCKLIRECGAHRIPAGVLRLYFSDGLIHTDTFDILVGKDRRTNDAVWTLGLTREDLLLAVLSPAELARPQLCVALVDLTPSEYAGKEHSEEWFLRKCIDEHLAVQRETHVVSKDEVTTQLHVPADLIAQFCASRQWEIRRGPTYFELAAHTELATMVTKRMQTFHEVHQAPLDMRFDESWFEDIRENAYQQRYRQYSAKVPLPAPRYVWHETAHMRWRFNHAVVLDAALAMSQLDLPPYVLLEIVDCLPHMWRQRHLLKINLIVGVRESYRGIYRVRLHSPITTQ